MAAVKAPERDARQILAASRRREERGRRRRRWTVIWIAIALIVCIVCFAAGLLAAPINYSFEPPQPRPVVLLDDHGKEFAEIEPPQQQQYVSSQAIPQVVKQAFVAAEDQRFYSENGIDPVAILRATWSDLTGGTFSGASTITQQYVKDVYSGTTSQRTPLRKLREAALAIRLDSHLTKDQILTRYLNNVYLGNGTVGVQAASKFYFGLPISKIDYDPATHRNAPDDSLGLARATMLAGIVPAPSDWNPVADPKAARSRQIYVLNRLVADKTITAQTATAALGKALPHIVAERQKPPATIAPQFRDIIEQQLAATYDEDTIYRSGGMAVSTTLDLRLQRAAVKALAQQLPSPKDPEAALVAVDPRTGAVRALAVKQNKYVTNGFNVATSEPNRSSGSTIKPFTLAYALEHGHHLGEVHYAPSEITAAKGYVVHNDDPAEAGDYTLESALAQSVNTVYAPLALKLGLSHIVHLARRAGMRIGHEPGCHPYCPSEALGVPVTPLSEADAYGVFVNGGIHHEPHFILGVRSGTGELSPPQVRGPDGNQVIPPQIAAKVKQAMAEVVTSGTGRAAAQPFPVYGKTGTTSRYTDAWFTGCTPTLCVTVWTGYNDSRPMYRNGEPVYGGTIPAQIFARFYTDDRLLAEGLSLTPSKPATPSAPVTYQPTSPQSPPAKPSGGGGGGQPVGFGH